MAVTLTRSRLLISVVMYFQDSLFEAAFLVLLLSGIPLAVSSAVGLLIAVIQSATQIQEQTISFAVKLLSVSLTIFVLSGWGFEKLLSLGQDGMRLIVLLGR